MRKPGITALAHPLDAKVATRHGVFVFEDIDMIRKRYSESKNNRNIAPWSDNSLW